MDTHTHIVEAIKHLTKQDQEELWRRVNQDLEDTTDSIAQVMEIKKVQQEKVIFKCPHCNSEDVVGHGNYQGRKRYRCKTCKKTFNDLTGTSISHIHKKDEWRAYLKCLADNLSLREAAKRVGVSFRTSFMWRHKIIGAFKDMGCTKLEGIVEGDETFFLYSEKGNKTIEGRKPRKRGGKAEKAGINKEHVAVIVSTDRNKHSIIEVAGRGRVSAKQIDLCLGKWIGENASALCTDSHRSYERFAKDKQLKHVRINASKGQYVKAKIYHVQNTNNIHSMLKDWMKQFKGVASGYLQNYMNWYRILKIAANDLTKYLDYAISSNSAYIPVQNIKPQYIIS
jgi:transposase-like protein